MRYVMSRQDSSDYSDTLFSRCIMNKVPAILFLLLVPILIKAQGKGGDSLILRTHSTMLGLGRINQLDSYLSPLEYTGPQVRIVQENTRPTRLLRGRVSMQNLIQANFSYTKSPTEDSKYLSGMLDWNLALHYMWQPAPALRFLAGPQLGMHGGGIYNTRNGNNPAQARLAIDLNASGLAIYSFRLFNRSLQARYQLDFLLAGMAFSPEYGQSYYEIFSLGQEKHNLCFTSPFSAVTVNQLLTLDIPVGASQMRIGIEHVMRQTHVNHLKTHDWTWLFLIGYVRHFSLVKP